MENRNGILSNKQRAEGGEAKELLASPTKNNIARCLLYVFLMLYDLRSFVFFLLFHSETKTTTSFLTSFVIIIFVSISS